MSKYPRTWNAQRGFTLIELVVVIAIIAILAGAIVPTLIEPRLQERASETAREMAAIEEAIMGRPELGDWGFLSHIGRIPASVDELLIRPAGWNVAGLRHGVVPRGWGGPYIRPASRSPGRDAWGTPYKIMTASGGRWKLQSFGPNRVDGPSGPTNDDIYFPSEDINDWYGSLGSVTLNFLYAQGNQAVASVPSADIKRVQLMYADGANPSTLDATTATCTTNPCTFAGIPFGLQAVEVELETTSNCGTLCNFTRSVRVLKPVSVVDVVLRPTPPP